MTEANNRINLPASEIRVLGALIEKSVTTPDYYPMTLNSLTAACNQKTSRSPVTNYSEQEVQEAINGLRAKSLVATATGGGSRAVKYKHNFGTVYPVSDAAIAVMCLLFLRGALTPGELNTNSGRLYSFSSLESVQDVLSELSAHDPPFVKQLPRAPGQKEARFVHLFGDMEPDFRDEPVSVSSAGQTPAGLEQRVAELEMQVASLKAILDRITGGGLQ